MDFATTLAAPVRVNIGGAGYDVPRFLLAQFKAWAAERAKKSMDAALAQYGEDADARARFMLYFQAAPLDVVTLLEEATTPAGVEHVLRTGLGAAKVPAEAIEAVLTTGDPVQLVTLTRILLSATATEQRKREESQDPGGRGDPLPVPPLTSGGSATITDATATPSESTAPASTQAA